MLNVLLIADIVGRPGRQLLHQFLSKLRIQHDIEFVVANAENCAHGFGVTPETAEELFRIGVDVLTTGNHIWDKKEIIDYIATQPRLLRPANYATSAPGRGYVTVNSTDRRIKIGVINLQGRVFMGPCDEPFAIAEKLVETMRNDTPIIFVDMHAEASSEKQAMGWFLDGKVTAVYGSHTHVPTADERVLPSGTAYVTDVGMTGPYDSVIGIEKDQIIRRFRDQMPAKFQVAEENPILHAMLVKVDPSTGRALSIKRIVCNGAQ